MTEPLKRYGGFLHPTHLCYDVPTAYCKAEDVAVLEARVQELEAKLAAIQSVADEWNLHYDDHMARVLRILHPEGGMSAVSINVHQRSIDHDGNIYEDGQRIGWQPPCVEHVVRPGCIACQRCHQYVYAPSTPPTRSSHD